MAEDNCLQRAYNPDTGGGVWLPILELWKTTNARRTKISIPAHKAKAASCDIIPQYVATWLEVYKLPRVQSTCTEGVQRSRVTVKLS